MSTSQNRWPKSRYYFIIEQIKQDTEPLSQKHWSDLLFGRDDLITSKPLSCNLSQKHRRTYKIRYLFQPSKSTFVRTIEICETLAQKVQLLFSLDGINSLKYWHPNAVYACGVENRSIFIIFEYTYQIGKSGNLY